jgi:hypothetical protein
MNLLGRVFDTAYEICAACGLALHRIYLFITAYAHLHFERFPPPDYTPPESDWKITKVLAFSEDEDDLGNVPDPDFSDVTEWFSFEMWENDVEDVFPEWTKWKLEVRYTHRDEKLRHVIRPGDSMDWPPSHPDATEHEHKLHELTKKPSGILSASLVPRPGIEGAKEVNITNRLRKYAGTTRDFGTSSEVRAHDIFPIDDNVYTAERFDAIRIIKTHPVEIVRVENVNFAENGLIAEKKKES